MGPVRPRKKIEDQFMLVLILILPGFLFQLMRTLSEPGDDIKDSSSQCILLGGVRMVQRILEIVKNYLPN